MVTGTWSTVCVQRRTGWPARSRIAFGGDDEGTYYLGLDGDKAPIDSVSSDPGHLLWQRAIDPERAARVVERLMAKEMWSGWGIRTLSADHVAYDPLSYQPGSVWPHDNAIAAAGFRAYGFDQEAATVAAGIFDATSRFASVRPPELFAGLTRDAGAFPVQYLGANVPQAWSSGAIVHLVDTFLDSTPTPVAASCASVRRSPNGWRR